MANIHGSDLEYAVREQARCRDLAGEGLGGARAVTGTSEDVLRRCEELVPESIGRTVVVPPGVDLRAFRPRPRGDALRVAAQLVEGDLPRRPLRDPQAAPVEGSHAAMVGPGKRLRE